MQLNCFTNEKITSFDVQKETAEREYTGQVKRRQRS